MEKSANTIGRRKFSRLTSRKQHQLLAELARDALQTGREATFLKRYAEMHSWVSLDRYAPPPWLTPDEALEEYIVFHSGMASKPLPGPDSTTRIAWQPRFRVEIVVDQVRSPYNAGSILRLIDNFGFVGLVHASSWLELTHPRLVKAARGCQQWIPVRYEPDLQAFLHRASVPVIGIENERNATAVRRWSPPPECILVLGNETYGIASAIRQCCRQCIRIPMFGYKASMNIHQALSVVAHKIVEAHG